ncbi:MAG: hypothetical protein KF809_08060 [Chloroflexi bacterium]|nr:hypothetical protein [Chloroflexota bacterium]
MQDTLRSLGAALDARLARDVTIRQTADGFHVRAQVAADLVDRIEGRWTTMEQVLGRSDMLRMGQGARILDGARDRRGIAPTPGAHEWSLDIVGRLVDRHRLTDVTLVEHRGHGGWLLWHHDPVRDRPTVRILGDAELRAEDLAGRTAAVGVGRSGQARHGGRRRMPVVARAGRGVLAIPREIPAEA